MIYANADQFAASGSAAVNAMAAVLDAAFASAEDALALNIETTRSLLEDSGSHTKALLAAGDLPGAMSLQMGWLQPGIAAAVAYSRAAYAISARTRNGLLQTLEEQQRETRKQYAAVLDNFARNAPAGGDIAIAAARGAVSATEATLDNLSKTAREINSLADASLAAVAAASEQPGRPGNGKQAQ